MYEPLNISCSRYCIAFLRYETLDLGIFFTSGTGIYFNPCNLATLPAREGSEDRYLSTEVDTKSPGNALNLLAFLAFLDIVLNIFIIYYYCIETPFI